MLRAYGRPWLIWVFVMAAAFSALWYEMLEGNMAGLPSLLWKLALLGAVVAPICEALTRERANDVAPWVGFLTGAGCVALVGAVLFAMTRDPEGRALMFFLAAFASVFSGVGGAVIGIFNARAETTV
jgi:hypothetical protein